MKVVFLTIALDAMPFITFHYPVFRLLPFEWEWHIVEGVATNTNDTKWCNSIPPRLSNDGTTEYIDSLSFDPNIKVYRSEQWNGKVAMVNEPLKWVVEPCLLVQIDSDEIWTVKQLIALRDLFMANPKKQMGWFYCNYYVGSDLLITTRNTYGNNTEYEWQRAWRYEPGMTFEKHEPPLLQGIDRKQAFTHKETERAGLVFQHYAYAIEKQLVFKSQYYPYPTAVEDWKRLQANRRWPARLSDFFPWVKDDARVQRLTKETR
jgi:hypothetical protein